MKTILVFVVMVLLISGCDQAQRTEIANNLTSNNDFKDYEIRYKTKETIKSEFGGSNEKEVMHTSTKKLGDLLDPNSNKVYKNIKIEKEKLSQEVYKTTGISSRIDVTAEIDLTKFNPDLQKINSTCTDAFSLHCDDSEKKCIFSDLGYQGANCESTQVGKDFDDLLRNEGNGRFNLVKTSKGSILECVARNEKSCDFQHLSISLGAGSPRGVDKKEYQLYKKIRAVLPNLPVTVHSFSDNIKTEADFVRVGEKL